MLKGKGIWIWQISSCEKGNIDSIVAKCIQYGISWLAIKIGDSGRNAQWSLQNAQVILQKCHAAGLQVYGWNYSIPTTINEQVQFMVGCAKENLDGLIIDAEMAEWQDDPNASTLATQFCQALRSQLGENYPLAFAPFAIYQYHLPYPYAAFANYCDYCFPQLYWSEFGNSLSYWAPLNEQGVSEFHKQNPSSRAQWYPIGVTYGKGVEGSYPLETVDINLFMSRYGQNNAPVSFYSYDASQPLFWETIAQYKQTIIQPVNPIFSAPPQIQDPASNITEVTTDISTISVNNTSEDKINND